jgi:hypothetical protein
MIDHTDLELLDRSLRHAHERHSGAALDEALAALGWADLLAADPRAAVSLQFEAQGAANTASSALDLVMAHAAGVGADAVVLPPLGRWCAPADATAGADGLVVHGLGTARLPAAERVLVVRADGDAHVGCVVPGAALAATPLQGVDPDLGLVAVGGALPAHADARPADWQAALDLGRLALAHELVGASRAMLDLARTHALARVQFDRPIAAFQAVRHRLAEALVAIEAAAATLDAAWLDRSPVTAAIAKAVAGRSARAVARHSQQVLAGIGFTTEHPFHRYFRRVLVLDGLLGGARALTAALGAEVLAARRLPPPVPL